jgi:ATP-binding cassette subfamily B (MDR/TAP) protein 1
MRGGQDALADASSTAEETLSSVRTVRSFASEPWSIYKYHTKLSTAFELAKRRSFYYGSFSGGMFLIANCALIGVLFYGGRLVLDGLLSVGNLLSCIMYTVSLAASLGMITSLFNDFMKAVGASKRVFDLLDRHPCIPILGGSQELVDFNGAIEFQGVGFAYPSRPEQHVLRDFSLSIAAGQTVALVGPSGGGKSTVVTLIKRFYDPMQGGVLIDGIDLRRLSRKSYMRHVASVMQEPVLFATSIRDNILYGMLDPPADFEATSSFNAAGLAELGGAASQTDARDGGKPGGSQEMCVRGGAHDLEAGAGDGGKGEGGGGSDVAAKIEAAARSANAWEFICSFSDGVDTLVGERGVRLSGGQKQRIAIARALMKQPRILLLDEATSALDSESERQVQASIDKLLAEGGRTTVVVAHRLSTIRGADAIAVVNQGQTVQMGTHEVLLQVSPRFYFCSLEVEADEPAVTAKRA